VDETLTSRADCDSHRATGGVAVLESPQAGKRHRPCEVSAAISVSTTPARSQGAVPSGAVQPSEYAELVRCQTHTSPTVARGRLQGGYGACGQATRGSLVTAYSPARPEK
jgi:hypothetical protein